MGTHRQRRGSGPISTTRGEAARRWLRRTAPTALALGLLVLLGAGPGAGPAAAVDDSSRPSARVTHGPSCRPGGLVVEVVAGSAPYAVRLATTRHPEGEDEATLAPGGTVILRTGDVAWGETIDGRLEFVARDGSGATFVDELDAYRFTRPTEQDCAAVAAPTTPDRPAASSGLRVAANQTGGERDGDPSLVPLVAAAGALAAAAGAFVSVLGRRSALRAGGVISRSAQRPVRGR